MSLTQRAIGLMSGTSMDGIDIAAIETDGKGYVCRLAHAHVPYCKTFRTLLRQAITDARQLTDRTARPGSLAETEVELTRLHAAAAVEFLTVHNWSIADFAVAGFHGQTVLHQPQHQLTVQLGDAQQLANEIGMPIAYDLRAADVAAGGQGAPLAPVYHLAMISKISERPVAVLNIGGVANVTWIGHNDTLIAFDTGPGNAAIDDWILKHTAMAYDNNGQTAATGNIDYKKLEQLCAHPYFAQRPPKSLDRNAFDLSNVNDLNLFDGAATLTAFTAVSIGKSVFQVPEEPMLWIVCGGGRRNTTLMSMLAAEVKNAVVPAEALGFNGDTVEAEAWAYLAIRALKGLPLSYPGTTGVTQPMTGGLVARPFS